MIEKIPHFYTGLPIVGRVLLFVPLAVVFIGAGIVWIWNSARMAQAAKRSDGAAGSSKAAGAEVSRQLGELGQVVDRGGKLVREAKDHRASDADLIREARNSIPK